MNQESGPKVGRWTGAPHVRLSFPPHAITIVRMPGRKSTTKHVSNHHDHKRRDDQISALGARGRTSLETWRWFDIPKDFDGSALFRSLFRNIEPWALEDEWEPQTVDDFTRMERWKVSTARRKIFVLPLSFRAHSDSGMHPSLEQFVEFIETYFALPVSVLEEATIKLDKRGKASLNGFPLGSSLSELGERRFDVLHILDYLFDNVPKSAYCVLAITDEDIFEDEEDPNTIMGRGSGDRVGVVSLYRFTPALSRPSSVDHTKNRNPLQTPLSSIEEDGEEDIVLESSLFLSRWLLDTCKTLAHETMHMFGLDHCTHFICVMNANVSPLNDGQDPIHLCPICLRKLHLSIGFDPSKRFSELLQFYKKQGWMDEVQFVQDRVELHRNASPVASSSSYPLYTTHDTS